MSFILKVLLTFLSLTQFSFFSNSLSVNHQLVKNISKENIENNEYITEPYYVIKNPSNVVKKEKQKSGSQGSYYKKSIEEVLLTERLELKNYDDYWYDSALEFTFKNISERDLVGDNEYFGTPRMNLMQKSYSFKVNLKLRQKSKEIQQEYSFHDKWNDLFIYTKLNLVVTRFHQGINALTLTGAIEEEFYYDPVANYRKVGEDFGCELKGGLILTKTKMNFQSKKGDLQKKDNKSNEYEMYINFNDVD
ncbi:hypothetical protein [Spiroplasma taiwanense]|uniref:Uncharacterized protein n=1 Tax=Spiroplasma taiwanense CT-1 TaxID=1276220 RepID=S5LUP9_9MOLU|nr:hypothetical protein [Spiroplasma taiwanense]AGR41529.1 hypothetical protein STAIW_v1c09430 [Spiroplasma taiwanense CT-1]